jgi:hypothetical protein
VRLISIPLGGRDLPDLVGYVLVFAITTGSIMARSKPVTKSFVQSAKFPMGISPVQTPKGVDSTGNFSGSTSTIRICSASRCGSFGGHNDQPEIRSRNGVRAAWRLRDIAATAGVNLSPAATVAAAPAHAMQHHQRRRWPS